MEKKNFIQRVNEFYPTYLEAHKNPWNKLIHVIGNLFVASTAIVGSAFILNTLPLFSAFFVMALVLPFHLTYTIYAFAWPAHIYIEKSPPATWTMSRWITKACDLKMLFQLFTFQLKWDGRTK